MKIFSQLSFPVGLASALLLSQPLGWSQDHSVYVPMEDGTRLAVDVWLPDESAPVPALLELTRYWRGFEDPRSGEPLPLRQPLDLFFLDAGYALVKVDVRGTGASFGTRNMEYGRAEVLDGYEIVEWVVAQPWCSGSVGAYGTSYTGTTAELLAAVEHPAVKAVVPGWSDFDLYRSPARPYGLYAEALIETWSSLVGSMDDNDSARLGAAVRRVDADADGSLRDAAVREHAANFDVARAISNADFRDTPVIEGGEALAQASPLAWETAIEASGTPMLAFASWLDSGTAAGALERLARFDNPQKLVILASNHGGAAHASPFVVGARPAPPLPPLDEQFALRLDFFDHYLRGLDRGVESWPSVRYFNLGEEEFHATDTWPPEGIERKRFYFGSDHALTEQIPLTEDGSDRHVVDFDVTTGGANVWATQLGGPVLRLDDRGAMDARMLTYTTEPLDADVQVTGTPTVTLVVTSDREDGAFLVYLEDVAPDGRSRYVTEGGLRAIHRARSATDSPLPRHSFAQADARPLVPGERTEIAFALWPTSVLFRKGHRIRIAVAGADAGTFARCPDAGTHTIEVWRTRNAASRCELPIVAR